jgi:hypothetical protein
MFLLIDYKKSLCKPNISSEKTRGMHAVSKTKDQKKTIEESLANLNWIKHSKNLNRESNYPESVKKS